MITGDGRSLTVTNTWLSFIEVYEFNDTSQLFELVEINDSLVFHGESLTHSEFNEAKTMLCVSSDKASYIFTYSNGFIHQIFKNPTESYYIAFSKDDKYMVTGETGIARVFKHKDSYPCNLSFCLSCNDSRCLVCNELLDYHLNETSGKCQQCP